MGSEEKAKGEEKKVDFALVSWQFNVLVFVVGSLFGRRLGGVEWD